MLERSATEVRPHLSLAAWAASSAAFHGRDVVEILAFDRLAPFAADEVAIFQLERRLDDFLMQHVILP
jgi:hypothetical protein